MPFGACIVTPHTHKMMGPPPKEVFAMDCIVRVDDKALEPFVSLASPIFDDLDEGEAQITLFLPSSLFTNDMAYHSFLCRCRASNKEEKEEPLPCSPSLLPSWVGLGHRCPGTSFVDAYEY
jgi:hypothetical protein